MLKKLWAGSMLAQAFAPDARSGPERLASSPWGTGTTPDQIIVAHILQSVVKKPEDWRWRNKVLPECDLLARYKELSNTPDDLRYGTTSFDLIGPDVSVLFELRIDKTNYGWKLFSVVTVDDGTRLDREAGDLLTTRIGLLFKQLAEVKRVAAKAKADMEAHERKWNLAEKLLGMKRNEHGALVPVNQAED